MDEVVDVLKDILRELEDLNSKMEDIRGSGMYSVSDVYEKMDGWSDIAEKLDAVDRTLNGIHMTVLAK